MKISIALLLFIVAIFTNGQVSAQTYPNKPVRVIVPFPPGGPTDNLARPVLQKLSESLGQQFIIDHRGGAGGNIGADAVAKAAPDGYTLLWTPTGTIAVNPSIYDKMPFDVSKDFIPVSLVAEVQGVLIVGSSVPVTSVAQLVSMAKSSPGKFTVSSAQLDVYVELFKQRAGIDLLHVPYKGAGPALLDVVAGRVDLLFDQVSSSSSYIEQGRVDALAVSSAIRWKSLSNVPTFIESGLQGFVITNFTGLVAPQGTPVDVLEKLNQVANAALQDDAVKKSFATMGVEGVGSSPQQFSALIKDDLQRWATLIKEKNIKLD